ncbi:MAG: hypothetical protein M3198_14290 [Actinomycetota bacterium]|nr:hypothetical protein [Actinomycetota bacterium]
MTTDGVQGHLAEVYGSEASRETISKITDRLPKDVAFAVDAFAQPGGDAPPTQLHQNRTVPLGTLISRTAYGWTSGPKPKDHELDGGTARGW